MEQNRLGKHFTLTPTWIVLRSENITEEDFRYAVIEFLEGDLHRRSRLGDLLNAYREKFGAKKLRHTLISQLHAKLLTSIKTCDNSMSLAKTYPPLDRVGIVPDAHMEELLSLKDEKARSRLLTKVANARKARKRFTLVQLRRDVRIAKRCTGQHITKGRKAPFKGHD